MDRFDQYKSTASSWLPFTTESEQAISPKVGLYENDTRLVQYDSGTLRLTKERLIWTDDNNNTLSLSLSLIKNVKFQKGFLSSHPKIHLSLLNKSWTHCSYISKAIKVGVLQRYGDTLQCKVCFGMNLWCDSRCHTCGMAVEFYDWVCKVCSCGNVDDVTRCSACSNPRGELELATVKLSFRGRNGELFHERLLLALQEKDWLNVKIKTISSGTVGVSGLLKQADASAKSNEDVLKSAFSDLDNLMSKATELVSIANIFTKVNDPGVNNAFLEIGLKAPVSKGENSFFVKLALEVGQFVAGQKVMPLSLVDVYCLYNRTRGTDLISPQDLLSACELMESLEKCPIKMTMLVSTMVLTSKNYSQNQVLDEIAEWVKHNSPAQIHSLASSKSFSILVAQELLIKAEESGIVCRDESVQGIYYYENIILNKY